MGAMINTGGIIGLMLEAWKRRSDQIASPSNGTYPPFGKIRSMLLKTCDATVGPEKDHRCIAFDIGSDTYSSLKSNQHLITFGVGGAGSVGFFGFSLPISWITASEAGLNPFATFGMIFDEEVVTDKKGTDHMYGHGRVNAQAAVDEALSKAN